MISKFNLGQLNAYKQMFSMKFSMQKQIKKNLIAGFFLPAINATVFRHLNKIGICFAEHLFFVLENIANVKYEY